MEQRVLVEVQVGGQCLGRRAIAEDRPDARPEHLGQVQVDGPDGPVKVDLPVQEQAGRQEHLERPQPGFVEGQSRLADERVAPQPLHVDRSHGDPGEVRVAPDVVQVVDGEHARQKRLQPAHPAGHGRVRQGGLGDEEGDPARLDRLTGGEGVALGEHARRPAQAGDDPAELALHDELAEVLVAERLGARAAGVGRGREVVQDVIVEEMGERSVAHVMEQAGDPERLDDQPLGRRDGPGCRVAECAAQAWVEVARPESGFVHDPQAVGEAAVFGGREDPAGALELADPAQPLDPGGVEQVLLGEFLERQVHARGGSRLQPLGQFDVPVDRVADQVDGGERVPAHRPGSGHPDAQGG